ncbi:hypothetical protein SPRG_00400 [Saprolegnia parasitica CBS 223.65]|uniref:Fe2OG dioxygenase domain-containing protein n=1 Tax=Saprolegnia parasitica (strain CBS 223.65) TaxID=695850 RepID=A0A067D230_SAPPC|nr:hypothetical protein SPRG_00400 [Saprolegnia parasitica CBS 223.65]KDO35555.1 hypothetical protein SPRG_00400 [Saprolegnia parasitica CBS 223.65]|eukprot:XP_012193889.1 hypothetical protein SPRG_00400 [Saprolegnia parasitica CBS 223.65]
MLRSFRKSAAPVLARAASSWTGPDVPTIDIRPLLDPHASTAARQPALRRMQAACYEDGFFAIPTSVLPRDELLCNVYSSMDAFHALAPSAKAKYHLQKVPNERGWTPLHQEPSHVPGVVAHLEGYDVARELPASYLALDDGLGPNVWPDDELPSFRHHVTALYDALTTVADGLFEGFAEMLHLPRTTLREFHTAEAQAGMRLLTYPTNDAPMDETHVGIAEHTDFECFTLLHQTNWGLQLTTRRGAVVNVPVATDQFIVLIGDVLERWTNGELIATPHRVLNTPGKRQSIARFNGTQRSAVIAPLPGFVSSSRPARYAAVTQRQHTLNAIMRPYTPSSSSEKNNTLG